MKALLILVNFSLLVNLANCDYGYHKPKCHTIYKTIYETIYQTHYKDECYTDYDKKCHTVYDTIYTTKYDTKCHTTYIPKCQYYYDTIYKKKCKYGYEEKVNILIPIL